MTILQKPADVNLSGNLSKFIIESAEGVDFILKKGMEILLSARYVPGKDGRIAIDVKDIVESSLSCVLKDQELPYIQEKLSASFTAEVGGQTINFIVVKGGVDRLATDASNFLRANWLTWQPQVKYVTYYVPEFLTFFAVENCTVKVKAYFSEEGKVTEAVEELYLASAGSAHTVPVQYAVIAGKFGSKLPSFYDVWFENSQGLRLSYVQRYAAGSKISENEDWVLFQNSLGGIDTFRAYGQSELTAEHTHNLAELGDVTEEYRVDTSRNFQKSTGWLDDRQRRWLLDFFPSPQKYLYTHNFLRKIIVVEDNTSFIEEELPSGYSFTFRYADAKPILNLPRIEGELPSDLQIEVPELGSFMIPPRLVEFPSQSLSEGVLFPVQNPYSENWATTTIGSILNYVVDTIIAIGGDGTGGLGHTHKNFQLLQGLQLIDQYLTVNGQKIKAGYADKAGTIESDIFLHKDKPDSTEFLLSMLAGAVFGQYEKGKSGGAIDSMGNANCMSLTTERLSSFEFVSGFPNGLGYMLASYLKKNAAGVDEKKYGMELDSLTVRGPMRVFEMIISQMMGENGNRLLSDMMRVDHIDAATNTIYLDTAEGILYNPFRADDILMVQQFEGVPGKENNYQVVKQYELKVVEAKVGNLADKEKRLDYIIYSNFVGDTKDVKEGDYLTRVDNLTDERRKGIIKFATVDEFGTPYIDIIHGLKTDPQNATKARFGNLEGLVTKEWGRLQGYGLMCENAYLKGSFKLVTGEDVKTKFEVQEGSILAEIKSRKEAVDGLRTDMTTSLSVQDGKISSAVEKVNTFEGQIESFGTRIDQTEASISTQATEISNHGTKISKLQQTVDGFSTTVTNAKASADEAKKLANAAKTAADDAATEANSAWWKGYYAQQDAAAAKESAATAITQSSDAVSAVAAKFNSDGSLKNTSGLVLTSDLSGLYSRMNNVEASISTCVRTDAAGNVIGEVHISGDKLSLEGYTTINESFKVAEDGSVQIGRFKVVGNRLEWNQSAYMGGVSRSLKLGYSSGYDGVVDVIFDAATDGRFGLKSVGRAPGGAAIYASSGTLTYPASSQTYAGFFVGAVDVRGNYGIASDAAASLEYRAITSRNYDGSYNYRKGISFTQGHDLDKVRIEVKNGIIVGLYKDNGSPIVTG